MRTITNALNDLLIQINFIIGLDGFRLISEMDVDGLIKYILYTARKNGDLDKRISLLYGEKLRGVNEYVRKYGPMNVLEECMDMYLEIGHMILVFEIQRWECE